MNLDFSPLENAIQRLHEALEKHEKYKNNPELFDTTRDSVVQRFEFTYEIATKLLAKLLREEGYERRVANVDNKPQLFRTAGIAGVINDVEVWLKHNRTRNATSHEYIEKVVASDEFYSSIQQFFRDVRQLLDDMKERQ